MKEEKKTKFLAEDGLIDVNDFVTGKLNLIEAPCGAGKTTFIEEVLWKEDWWGDLLYLIDSRNGRKAFNKRGKKFNINWDTGEEYYTHENITAMTYAGFACLCLHNPDLHYWDGEGCVIVCDELQSAINWRHFTKDEIRLHELALKEIHQRIAGEAKVIAISATTDKIRKEFKGKIKDIPIYGDVPRYTVQHEEKYNDINKVLDVLLADKKGMIYIPHISEMLKISQILTERNISNACIWSENNEKYTMDTNGIKARNSILENETIPDDVQVLIVNASCETGINIKSEVDYVVIHSSNKDTITQVIGRVRHDIETAYILSKNTDEITVVVPEEFLGHPLGKVDKDRLCQYLKLKNEKGRILKWTSLKEKLSNSGYKIISTKTNQKRFDMILK